jgi:hypothetical protein
MSSTDHEISISFGVVGNCAIARAKARRRGDAPLARLEGISEAIIDSVSDYHETIERPSEVGFAVMKQARPMVAPA